MSKLVTILTKLNKQATGLTMKTAPKNHKCKYMPDRFKIETADTEGGLTWFLYLLDLEINEWDEDFNILIFFNVHGVQKY